MGEIENVTQILLDTYKKAVEAKDLHIIPDQKITGLYAYFTFTGESDSGEVMHSMDNRFTWILKNQKSNWKIIHEHSSAPIDFESNKVILKRFTTRRNESI